MGRGSSPGERRGGRGKGTPNKKTVERQMVSQWVDERTKPKHKLAKEVMEDFMMYFARRAAQFQPLNPDGSVNPTANDSKFMELGKLACEVAAKLAPYQSPTFRAITVAPAPPTGGRGDPQAKRFTLAVFDLDGRELQDITPKSPLADLPAPAPKAAAAKAAVIHDLSDDDEDDGL